jgi:endonuclease/exonuclease/phosphatase family metal-dependent hydrolase
LLSVYAPLQTRQQQVERAKFVAALQEVTHSLDMQVPTVLMGDFNGSAYPGRDFHGSTSARRAACPLLVQLLGPGGAWVDVHATMLSEPLA